MKNNKDSRAIIRNISSDLRSEAKRLHDRADMLDRCLERMVCGCLSLDCTEHGSYTTDDIALVEYYLTFNQ